MVATRPRASLEDEYDASLTGKRQRTTRRCSTCEKTFTKQDHLDRHIRSHTKEKPFECTHCGKSYGRKSDTLARHMRDQHDPKQSVTSTAELTIPSFRSSSLQIGSQTRDVGKQGVEDSGMEDTIEAAPTFPTRQEPLLQWPNAAALQPNLGDGLSFDTDMPFLPWLIDESFDDFSGLPFANPGKDFESSLQFQHPEQEQAVTKPLKNMRDLWFTHFKTSSSEQPTSGIATPTKRLHGVQVDDEYRRSLQSKLQIKPIENKLPSTNVLNVCIDAYFKYFHPIFPVIHVPTFRPSKARAVLLISIASLGSLFTGSPGGLQQGVYMFEHLHKAMIAKWEGILSEGDDEALAAIQASLLGQTFAFLSGDPQHLAVAEAFHGTVISWSRRRKVFTAKHKPHDSLPLSGQELVNRWKDWAKTEECLRVTLGLYIHDGELAATFHHESLLRYSPARIPISASFSVFEAPTTHEWRKANAAELNELSRGPQCVTTPSFDFSAFGSPSSSSVFLDGFQQHLKGMPRSSYLSIYATLENISVAVIESRLNESLSWQLMEKFQDLLIAIDERLELSGYAHYPNKLAEARDINLAILWHLIFITLYTDFDLLERASGRDGSPDDRLDADDKNQINEWASSHLAKRSVLHALMIKRRVENLPLGLEPAMHVPRALFSAAMCIYCYTRYRSPESTASAAREPLDFQEFEGLGLSTTQLLFEVNGNKHIDPVPVEANGCLCRLIDLLETVGHWQIARKFAVMLRVLVHGDEGKAGGDALLRHH